MKAFAGNTKWYQEGMDLRDYFAAQAMQGLIEAFEGGDLTQILQQLPNKAYEYADAMMKAREQ